MYQLSTKFTPLHLLSIVVALLTASIPAYAGDPSTAFDQMMSKLRSLKSFEVTVQETTLLQPTDPTAKARTITSSDEIDYKAPNLFSLINNSLMGGVTVVSDGKTEYIYSSLTQEYAAIPAPRDILGNVLGSLQRGTTHWSTEKRSTVNGVAVKELNGALSTPRGMAQVTLYINSSDFLPLEAVISLPTVSGATGNGLKITRTQLFADPKLNQPIPNSLFTFSPPEGSTKVDSPTDLGGGFGGG
jgi:outer membrane lipoprotein-sorting protein